MFLTSWVYSPLPSPLGTHSRNARTHALKGADENTRAKKREPRLAAFPTVGTIVRIAPTVRGVSTTPMPANRKQDGTRSHLARAMTSLDDKPHSASANIL